MGSNPVPPLIQIESVFMRAHLSKFFFIYVWVAYLIWVMVRIIFLHDKFTSLNWCDSAIALLLGFYQLSEAKMDLDLQHLRDIDQGRA